MIDYDKISALNWSTLKLLDEDSAAHARHKIDHPEERKDKAEFVSGRAVHCATLEPDDFDLRYEVMPVFKGVGSVAAKREWLDGLPDGVEALKQDDYDMAWRCAAAIRANRYAMELLEGAKYEQIIQWELSGVKCKGRADILSDRVVDLKSTRRTKFYDVEKDAATYNYHAQLAWYHDGAVKAGLISGEILPAGIFIHASQKSTFVDIAILDMEGIAGTFLYGRGKYRSLLDKYIGCMESGWWPGMAPKPKLWTLPEWKLRADADEVKELKV